MSVRRVVLMAVVAGCLATVAWVGWVVWQVSADLRDASEDAADLQQALINSDADTVDSSLRDLQEHAGSARERSGGATWDALTKLPWLGDDARAVRTICRVMDDLADSGLEPLANSAANLDSFAPKDGRIPLEPLERLQGPVARAADAFAAAGRALSQEDSRPMVGPLRTRYTEIEEKVAAAATALDSAKIALGLLPGMLGDGGSRNYLLVFQNNAEVRATGGLPGAVSLLEAADGRLNLKRQAAGAQFGEADVPVLPLSDAERAIYGRQLGTYFLDANFTPNFARASALWSARWKQEFPNDEINGVIALDPVALSYLLQATGPITIGDVTLTPDNVVSELLHQTYMRYPGDPDAQDAYFRRVAQAVFATLTSAVEDPRLLLSGLRRAAAEHRLLLSSFDAREATVLAKTSLGGTFSSSDDSSPHVGVTLNDTTGAKMSYYLDYRVRVDATSCLAGAIQTLAGEAHLTSLAPQDAASTLPPAVTGGGAYGIPSGSQLVTLRLYGPLGGRIDQVSFNSQPLDQVTSVNQDGRPVVTAYVNLDPGTTADVAWTMRSGANQSGSVTVDVTPSVAPVKTSSVAESACQN